MDTPPPILPDAPSSAVPAANAIDAKLLKAARNAGRNLYALAVLTTLGVIAMIAVAFVAKGMQGFMAVLVTTLAVIATGYWVLAVAARRGNPNAVGVVIVAMGLQICLALISSGVTAALNNTPFQLPVGGLFIPILVLIALGSSRKVLLDLKERQLWDQVFGSAKPSGDLCLLGGVLLATGFLALNTGTYYIGWKVGQQRQAEFQQAKAFVQLIEVDEKEFLTAIEGISDKQAQQQTEMALTKFKTLEQKFEVFKKEAAGSDRMLQILTTYGMALREWKNGLTLLSGRNADMARVQQMLELGDRLRVQACEEFDRRYASKKSQAGI